MFLLLAFINRKFWWPKKRKFRFSKFLSFILKNKKKLRPFFLFISRNEIGHIARKKFYYLFDKTWLLSKFRRYYQRRKIIYKYAKRNLNNLRVLSRQNKVLLPKVILRFTINNIFLTIQDVKSRNLTYFSAGLVGFSGPTRKTTFAFEQLLTKVCNYLKIKRLKKIHLVVLSGGFSYRTKSIVELFYKFNVYVKVATYKINLPHNGMRSRKLKRR